MDMLKVVALGAAVTAGLVLARPSLADAVPEAPVSKTDLPPAASSADIPEPPPPPADVAPPAPPAPAELAAPPAPPVPPNKHHMVRVMRFHTPDGDRVVTMDGNNYHPDMGGMTPEDEKALLEAHKAVAKAQKQLQHMVIIKRGEIDKAVAEAMEAHHAVALNKEQLRKIAAEAQTSRIRALEQARDEIDRELAEAKAEAAAKNEGERNK